ncbi:HAD family acid phosphatase [Nocardioides nematodiphilus]|uniref:HAD family acid phosphatase n=1 Tax=Nocardioides nematodiphilus TaxID=2849669 RepID=UPI001CDA418D|nr:HAD family acid phosphatase [Nocardioides nematodiphilus]MCA1981298.1 hypothetical protein [Nocardioides nematodiphilus]
MRVTRPAVTIAACAALVTTMVTGAPAHAADPLSPATSFSFTVNQDGTVVAPTDGGAIPNIDSVKSTLRAYYGTGTTKVDDPAYVFATDGLDGDDVSTVPQKTYLPNLDTSPYATNTKAVADAIDAALPDAPAANTAVVFDVDSTLLSDYGNEEDMSFNYSPAVNAIWVNHELFPAVAGMPALLRKLAGQGYKIYGITGRPAAQETHTLGNLVKAGYTSDGTATGTPLFDGDTLFTKDLANQPWVDCTADGSAATACSTVEYKALTRKHIQDTDGVTIAMNVGDQWSDLEGGYAAKSQKVPNPSYFLPSADITGAPAGDSAMVLPKMYTMAPDGSGGPTATDGDAIPNEGAVVSLIRAYYNAPSSGANKGIADKTTSPYITQLTALEASWTPKITTACQQGVATAAATRLAGSKATAALTTDTRAVTKATKAVARAVRQLKQAKRHHTGASHVVRQKKKALAKARRALTKARATLAADRAAIAAAKVVKDPAVVFDADDTTLWTYDMEDGAMGFAFNPALQDVWVQGKKFAATPGMPALAKAVAKAGCTVIGLTGRNTAQEDATIANLTEQGYVDAAGKPLFTAANYYTKWVSPATPPAYITCADPAKCTTIEYKSGTRKYLESQKGLDIVANLGDQFSDLIGGAADATYKLPNPTYYLP